MAMQSLSADGHRAFVRGEPKGTPVPDAAVVRAWFEQYGEVDDVHVPARAPDVCYVMLRHAQSLFRILEDTPAGGLTAMGPCTVTIQKAMPHGYQAPMVANTPPGGQAWQGFDSGGTLGGGSGGLTLDAQTMRGLGLDAHTLQSIGVDAQTLQAAGFSNLDIGGLGFGAELGPHAGGGNVGAHVAAGLTAGGRSGGGSSGFNAADAQAVALQAAESRGGGRAGGLSAGGSQHPHLPGDKGSVGSTRVYVTGAVQLIGEEALTRHFSQFGIVNDVYIPIDRATGTKKPFAFVTMNAPQERATILSLPTHKLTEDISVNVTAAESRGLGGKGERGFGIDGRGDDRGYGESCRSGSGGFAGGSGGFGGGRAGFSDPCGLGGGLGSVDLNLLPAPDGHGGLDVHNGAEFQHATNNGTGPKQGIPGEHRIFVLGMPDGLNADMLRGHFARHGEILDIYIPISCKSARPRSDGSPDIAYITFSTQQEMNDALLNSGLRIAGLEVKEIKQAGPRTPKGEGKGKSRFNPY